VDVYVIRHAIAAERDAGLWSDDSLRPLTKAGKERFRAVARGLKALGAGVDAVLSSPAVRARETAELLTAEAGWPEPQEAPELAPGRPVAGLVPVLARRAGRSVALVGHEPALSMLVSLLLAGDELAVEVELKKGGVVLLTCGAEPRPGAAVLRWSVPPRVFRALG
jgi:phosphohistidine phosphatase